MKRVGVAELKNNLSRYLRAAEMGQTIEITNRARGVARLVPVDPGRRVLIAPATRLIADVQARRIPPLNLAIDLATVLDDERADRVPPG